MNIRRQSRTSNLLLALLLVAASVLPIISAQHASAASLSQVFVRFDTMKISTGTTGTVCAKPATASTEAKVVVTFPTGYTLGAFGTFSVNTTNLAWPAGGTAWLGIAAPTGAGDITGQSVSFASTDLIVGTLYCFNWTNTAAVQVKSSATASNLGSVTTRDSVPADIDTANYSTASITNDVIQVTATVPQAFSFALSGNTDALGTLTTGSVTPSPTPRTATVNTNAKNGWTVWAKDSNTGLNSTTASSTIASTTPGSNSTLGAGSNGYNTGVTSSQVGGSGSITVQTPFVGGTLGKGGGLDTSLRALASSGGTADTAVLTLTNNASIAPTQAAATDYTDNITVIGAGLF